MAVSTIEGPISRPCQRFHGRRLRSPVVANVLFWSLESDAPSGASPETRDPTSPGASPSARTGRPGASVLPAVGTLVPVGVWPVTVAAHVPPSRSRRPRVITSAAGSRTVAPYCLMVGRATSAMSPLNFPRGGKQDEARSGL